MECPLIDLENAAFFLFLVPRRGTFHIEGCYEEDMERKRKNIFQSLRCLIGSAIFLAWALSVLACGGAASPPLGIPAPVSNLMTLDAPDANGTVAIVGQPGAVLQDAIVSGANITEGGVVRLWQRVLFSVAHAQALERDVVAAGDGSFRMRVFGKSGDTIRIVQTVGGEKSPGTDLIVP